MTTPTNASESAGGERHGSCCHAPEYDHHERRPDCDGTGDKYDLPCFGQHHPFVAETPSPEVGMGEMLQMLIGRSDFGELETSRRLLPDKSYQSEWSMAFYFGGDDYSLFCGSTWREVVSKAYRHFYAAAKETK